MRVLFLFPLVVSLSVWGAYTQDRPLEELSEDELVARAESSSGVEAVRARARLGLLYEEQERYEEAIPLLERSAAEYEAVRPWLLVRLAGALDRAGRHAEAANVGERIISELAGSRAAALATVRLPAWWARAEEMERARVASRALRRLPIDALTETDLVATADVLASAGLHDEATRIRERILRDYTRGRYTERLYDQLVEIPGDESPLYSLGFEASVRLADQLQSANRHPEAQDWIARIRQRFPKRASDPRLVWVEANTLFRSRQYEKLQELEIPEGAYRHVGLTRLQGHGLWRIDRNDEFLEKMQHIVDHHSNTSELPVVQVLLGKYYLINGDDEDLAAQWLKKAIDAGNRGDSGENLWTLTWIHIKAGRYEEALEVMSDYLSRYPDDSYTSNSLFWSGKIHQWLGQEEEARRSWNRLLEQLPYTYYAWRVREILELPPPSLSIASGEGFPSGSIDALARREPRLGVVSELDLLGLHAEAIDYYLEIVGNSPDEPILAFALADRFEKAGEPLRAIGILNRHFRDIIRRGGTGIPQRFWEILYPMAYRDQIWAAAAEQNVDPWLMTAIIRQESGWDPSIVSSAGATGLMQIMPNEAAYLGKRAGFDREVTREMLFDPAVNIRVGAAEIRSKLDLMDQHEMLAIAAYNAGESAVGVWLERTPLDDRDFFIDSIPYNETRRYVMAVTRNRHQYKLIYGAD